MRQPASGGQITEMDRPVSIPLDDLAAAALAGDGAAEKSLYRSLGERFLALAKRRVREDDAEDVAQEALAIVLAKQGARSPGQGILVWSLAVLRNVIGNYYQAKEREGRRMIHPGDMEKLPGAVEAPAEEWGARLAAEEETARIRRGVAILGREDGRCGSIFRVILAGLAAGDELAEAGRRAFEKVRDRFPDMNRGAFYVALHRCRSRLRRVLEAMDVGAVDPAGGEA